MSDFKVGLLVIVAIAVAIFGIWTLGTPFQDTVIIYVDFNNIGGLARGSEVKLQGVTIGTVEEMHPNYRLGQVFLACRILRERLEQIGLDSVATIESSGIVGGDFVQLTFRSTETPPLQPGQHVRGLPSTGLGDVTEQLINTLSAIQSVLGSPEAQENIRQTLENLRDITSDVQGLIAEIGSATDAVEAIRVAATEMRQAASSFRVAASTATKLLGDISPGITGTVEDVSATANWIRNEARGQVEQALASFDQLAANLEQTGAGLDSLVGESQEKISRTLSSFEVGAATFTVVLQKVDQAMERIDRVIQNVEEGQGPAGRLLTDKKWEKQVDDTLDGFSRLGSGISRLTRPNFYYDFRYYDEDKEVRGDDSDIRNDLGLRFWLSDENVLSVGVNDLGDENELELTLGHLFWDRILLYGGVIESEAGLGTGIYLHDRVRLYAEGVALTESGEERLDVFAEIWPLRNLYLFVGAEDIADDQYLMGGLGLFY